MRNIWRKYFITAALTFMLCLTGMVMSGEAQAQRFTDNGNGTVTDTVTGLMRTKNANPFGELNWDEAMARCSSFSISGIGGWRLPSKDELVALSSALRGEHPFTGVQSPYHWSSTAFAGDTDYAWLVSMKDGQAYSTNKTAITHVWPVRASQ